MKIAVLLTAIVLPQLGKEPIVQHPFPEILVLSNI